MTKKILIDLIKNVEEIHWETDLYTALSLSLWERVDQGPLMQSWIEDRKRTFP
jgi:hypothetical protein